MTPISESYCTFD